MPAQKRPPPSSSPSPSPPSSAVGDNCPPSPSTAERAEKRPKLDENGTANGNGNDFIDTKSAAAAGSESESEVDDAATEKEFIPVKLSDVRKEVQCPICLGIIRKTRTVMECLHRFCRECIDKSMRLGNNECPSCRTHCASRRSLRDDPNYDALISALYPDIDKYEEEELAFNDEENDRNKQIQASIAEAFQKQSEVIGQKFTARATAAAFVRRSRRNMRANGQSKYLRGRGRASSHDVGLSCSNDEQEGNGENYGKESSSAEESSPEKKQKRLPKWPTPRSSPARAGCSDEVADDDKDDVGITRENFSTSPLRAWGKNGTRSQTRHGNFSNSNGRVVKGGRMIKLVDCLRTSDDNDGERGVHLFLIPLDGQTMPNLEKSYLCCGPTLSVKHLCQFVAGQTSHKDEEVEMYTVKSPRSDRNKISSEKAKLAGEERLSDLCSQFTSPNGDLELAYAIKMSN
ncbi:putative E3 ubiquitin-protein ligase RING1a [Lolium rigidum]|uniref:putative E3 ubiquitin-protein ligase RING1a n=1 Tax=Lolium rigidum TaxID=89674 RepID=UPI001F5D8992|nr:putative E3 ubiquitin-protein ligase RING1a [Lolium rigidum]